MRLKAAAGIGIAAVALAFSLSACSSSSGDSPAKAAKDSSSSEPSMSATQDMAASPSMTAAPSMTAGAQRTGMFNGLNGKKVAGEVTVAGDTVTLSGFSSDQGPDLHLYLAKGTDEAAVTAGTELGAVAYDKAAQTFMLKGADAAGFTEVVVHCDKAKAVFGAAALS
jgi:ABC-type oligopeptide transport system substrate-binding subunit